MRDQYLFGKIKEYIAVKNSIIRILTEKIGEKIQFPAFNVNIIEEDDAFGIVVSGIPLKLDDIDYIENLGFSYDYTYAETTMDYVYIFWEDFL